MPKDKIGDVKVMNNEYDNEKFFEEYAKMSRSKEGLKAAGEWHQLKPLFPSLEGKSVLDLGCGYGWHCKFAEEQGATKILGIDLYTYFVSKWVNREYRQLFTKNQFHQAMKHAKVNNLSTVTYEQVLSIFNSYLLFNGRK